MIQPIVSLHDVSAKYQGVITALQNISISVADGTIVALVGSNGAGKTTTLKAISNLLVPEGGRVTGGKIMYKGSNIERTEAFELVNNGLVQVLEGRRCFAHLTVEENLLAGGYASGCSKRETQDRLEQTFTWFPRLKTRRKSLAGLTSGGEQQMVAIGRALISNPNVVLLDEPSMGLAPIIVQEIFEIVKRLNKEQGTTFVLAEQNLNLALKYADYGYVLENGRMVLEDTAANLLKRDDIHDFYLGGAVGG